MIFWSRGGRKGGGVEGGECLGFIYRSTFQHTQRTLHHYHTLVVLSYIYSHGCPGAHWLTKAWQPICANGPLNPHPSSTHIHERQCGWSVWPKDTKTNSNGEGCKYVKWKDSIVSVRLGLFITHVIIIITIMCFKRNPMLSFRCN